MLNELFTVYLHHNLSVKCIASSEWKTKTPSEWSCEELLGHSMENYPSITWTVYTHEITGKSLLETERWSESLSQGTTITKYQQQLRNLQGMK